MRSARADILFFLRSDSRDTPACLNDEAFWDVARREGMLPLVVDRLASRGWTSVDSTPRAILARERVDDVARAQSDAADLRRVLRWLHDAQIPALVLKGAALAYTHYDHPHLRPMVDVDLLIRPQDEARARATFEANGAEWMPHVSGEFVLSQFHYVTTDPAGGRHTYDIHWRAVNPLPFMGAFDWERLATSMVPVTPLGPDARTVSAPVALQLACVHKAAHHAASDRLIWLFDIHLLAESLSHDASAELVEVSVRHRIAALVLQGVREAHEAFGGTNSARLVVALEPIVHERRETSARFLEPDRRAVADLLHDFKALPRWRQRLRFVRELVLPPGEYMRRRYERAPWVPLPLLYVARVVAGGIGLIRRR